MPAVLINLGLQYPYKEPTISWPLMDDKTMHCASCWDQSGE